MVLRSLALVLLAMFWWPTSASATTCERPTPDKTPDYSDVIFEAVAKSELEVNGGRSRYTRLVVNKVYRGEVPMKVAALHGGMKGFPPFVLGRRYLVFASLQSPNEDSKFGPTVFVHLCHATHILPRQDHFAQRPWKDFDPAKSFGTPRKPGETLLGARPQQTPAAAPPASDAAPPASDAAPPASDAEAAAGTETSPTSVAPTSPAPKPSRGCGCVVGRNAYSADLWLAFFVIFLIPLRRRPLGRG